VQRLAGETICFQLWECAPLRNHKAVIFDVGQQLKDHAPRSRCRVILDVALDGGVALRRKGKEAAAAGTLPAPIYGFYFSEALWTFIPTDLPA